MTLYTIGFTKKSASEFFGIIKKNNISRLIDIRESNTNIYAGFTMRDSLAYFLNEICNTEYVEMKDLAPTKALRKLYHENENWDEYANGYLRLLNDRKIGDRLDREIFHNAVLLCSEPTAEKCHRRLAAEYIAEHLSDILIIHL